MDDFEQMKTNHYRRRTAGIRILFKDFKVLYLNQGQLNGARIQQASKTWNYNFLGRGGNII